MLNALLDQLRPPGLEMKDIIQSTSFLKFVEKTALMTIGTELPGLAQSLVNRISLFCEPDEFNNFARVRGGSMRSDLFNNQAVDKRFSKIFEKIDQALLGNDPMAGQVVDKVFSLPKDIDVFFRSTLPNELVHDEDVLFHNIIGELNEQGYRELEQNKNGNVIILTNGQYQVKVLKHQTGVEHRQTLVKIDVGKNDEVLMKLHFGLIPNEQESREDPRSFDETADIEQEAVGYLNKNGGNEIPLRYFGFDSLNYVQLYMRDHFFDPILHKFMIENEKNPDQIISSRIREINFRVALFPSLFDIQGIKGIEGDLQNTPFYMLLTKYCMRFGSTGFDKKDITKMKKWFQKNNQNMKDHFKLTASDITYGLTANPFLFFLFALPTDILSAFPIGEKLDFTSTMNFLDQLAKKVGGDISKDSLLTLSLKYYTSIRSPEDTTIFKMMKFFDEPETISAFLKLINPLLNLQHPVFD